jgi:hypothetical protein
MDIHFTITPTTGEITAHVGLGSRDALAEQTPRGAANLVVEMAEEFRTKLAEFTDWLRSDSAPSITRAPAFPSATNAPSCKGCGTSVERVGDLCPSCAHKKYLQSPEPRIAIANQGEPLYKREGSFRDIDAPKDTNESSEVGVSE